MTLFRTRNQLLFTFSNSLLYDTCTYSLVVYLYVLCSQNVLRELEQKKPQLDELVHTAENLKADSNRQQLHGKGRPHLQKKHFFESMS